MHNHSYENEFNLLVDEISFSCERMSTKTRFEKEAKGNSEMAYYGTGSESASALTTATSLLLSSYRPCNFPLDNLFLDQDYTLGGHDHVDLSCPGNH